MSRLKSVLDGWRTFSVGPSLLLLVCAVLTGASSGQTFTKLVDFNGANGALPYYMSLQQGTDGNLYGTASQGGASGNGTVFKITANGSLTTVHSFDGSGDGSFPTDTLFQASNGNFYGTNGGGLGGGGTVFKVTSAGKLTTLYSFLCDQTSCPAGGGLWAGLVQGRDGNFYGDTNEGGPKGGGTLFKITPTGTLTTLHNFCSLTNCVDGRNPSMALVLGKDGNFYGTAAGGSNNFGLVFKLTPAGALTTIYNLQATDGQGIVGALIQATNGAFYGTAEARGSTDNGTVFKVTAGGQYATLYSFCIKANCSDGSAPEGPLVQASDGNFYGTTEFGGITEFGGSFGAGTVFKLTPAGVLTTLHSFCGEANCTDGSRPYGGLVQNTNGKFYGTTNAGGTFNEGTIFSLDVGLAPFVESRPTSGKVGARIIILGTNLTGTASVSFNGTPATFTVVSGSELTTTVPSGATSGKITVTTPDGSLLSNVAFHIF